MNLLDRVKTRFALREDRKTLVVSRNSWHGRLYHFWRDHAEFKTSGYRENLCHYVRVILLWGPLALFLHLHPKRAPYVRPATVTALLAILAGAAWAMIYHPGDLFAVLWRVLVVMALTALGTYLLYLIDRHKNDIKNWWIEDGRGVGPVKKLGREFVLTFKGFVSACKKIGSALAFKIGKVPVWTLLLAAVFAVGVYIDIIVLWLVLGTIAFLFGGGMVLLVANIIADALVDYLRSRRIQREYTEPRDEGILKVGTRFVVAKKGKICPFIEVQ